MPAFRTSPVAVQFQRILGVVGLCLLLAGLAGCKTRPTPRSTLPESVAATNSAGAAIEEPPYLTGDERAEAHARFLLGMSAEAGDNGRAALGEFYKAALIDARDESLVTSVYSGLIITRQFEKAVTLMEKATAQPGAGATAYSRLSVARLQVGETNAALTAARRAIERGPREIVGYETMHQLLRRVGRTNEASAVLDEAFREAGVTPDFEAELGTIYLSEFRPSAETNNPARMRAVDLFERSLARNPTNLFTLQKISDGFASLGMGEPAAVALRRLQELYPDVQGLRERLAELYIRNRDPKRAQEQLEAVVRESPNNAQAWFFLGALAFDEKKWERAVECYRRTLLIAPSFEPVYADLASAYLAQDRPLDTLRVLDQARTRFGRSFSGEYFSALAHSSLKNFTNAISHLISAEVIARTRETNRLTHYFYFQMGSIYERAGNIPAAEQYLQKCLAMEPDFDEALNYLGYMWAERGTNLVAARSMIEKALRHEPDNAAYLDSLAWVLFRQGDNREALVYIERAIQLNREPDPTLYDHLGDIQQALGNTVRAREAWQKSVELEPNPTVKRKLKPVDDDGAKPPSR